DLDPLILAIRDPQLPFRIECQSVRHIKFAGFLPFAAPGFDEGSILVKLQDTRVTIRTRCMPLRDKDVTVIRDSNIVRLVQKMHRSGPLATLTLGSECHQDLSLRVKLHYSVCADIGGPDVPLFIDTQSVRPREEPLAKRSNEFPIVVKLE